jgi:hypothetical protein
MGFNSAFKGFKESASIKVVQLKENFYIIIRYYGLTIFFKKKYRNTRNVCDKNITMEELKEALKKTENHLGEDSLDFELYKNAKDSFHETVMFFLITFR